MFIFQNSVKQQLQNLEFVRTVYNGENTEIIAQTLANAYAYKNDLFKVLNLTLEQMYNEFIQFLKNRSYQWILVYYEKKQYEKQIYDIIAVISYTDIYDVQPTNDEIKIKNYDIVPTLSKVRQYVKLKALDYFFSNYKPQYGEFCLTGAFGFSSKYMGARHSLVIYADSIKFIQSKGYKFGFGWTASDVAKNLYDKLHLLLREEQSLSNLYVDEIKCYPYKNTNLVQVLYIGEVDKSVIKLNQILQSKKI